MEIKEIDINKIKPDKNQPRTDFSGLNEMAETIMTSTIRATQR